jgi:uncharacterized protein (UPF0248 family)
VQPLQELFHRIRWDAEFGRASFAIGYWDRVAQAEQVVPFSAVTFDPDRPGMFSMQDEDGIVRHIPLHRVRTVYRDGVVVWRRRPGAAPDLR